MMKVIEFRAFFLGFVGLALSFYSLTNGQSEWTVGVNGLFGSPDVVTSHSYSLPSGGKIIVGLGVIPSIISGVLSACLIVGVLTSSKVLLLPPLIHTISELVKDVATSIITSILVYARFGNPPTLIFIVINSAVIALNSYLWYGAQQLYEYISLMEDLADYERGMKHPEELRKRNRERLEPKTVKFSDTYNLSFLESNKTIAEEFEEFKRKERENEKYKIEYNKNSFIESLKDIDLDLLKNE